MNKKLFRISFVLLMCWLLAGCGSESEPECQHEWREADCLNASSCALCGEVREQALGHDWTEASCESPESCSRCGETQGEALGHSFGQWLLDEKEMYRICPTCEQTESAEIDYALYLDQHIYGRWNLCSMVRGGRYLDSYMLPQDEVDPEYCFYEDGRVSSMGFEEKEISQSWSFDYGEYDSENYQHNIYISFPENNELSAAHFTCIGDEVYYEVPLDDEGDAVTLSNSFGDAVGKALVGTWSAWSQGSIYNINFLEDRSFTADIDGEISGFWQPRQSYANYDGGSIDVHIMLSYLKDGEEHSEFATLNGFREGLSQKLLADSMAFAVDVKGTYSHFGLDAKEFLTETAKTADSAHLGTWTSTESIVSTPNYETYGSDEESDLSTEYSIVFNEDGSFSAKLNREIEGQWSLREIRREYMGVCMVYNLTAPGISDYSYFQMYDSGDGYAYISYTDNVSANYSFKQMNEEEIAAWNDLAENAPGMVVGEWFSTGEDFKAVFSEDGTFTISSGTAPEMYNYNGYWYFNTISEHQGEYTYLYDIEYDIETIMETEGSDNTEDTEFAAVMANLEAAMDAVGAEPAEHLTYREDYALRLEVKDGLYTLELSSVFVSGSLTNAEGLTVMEDAASAITGHWSADAAKEYDRETQQGTDVSVDFYLDISKDGSFTGSLGEEVRGSWEFFELQDGKVRYLFTFIGAPMASLSTLEGETLSCYFEPYMIDFNK